MNAEDLARTIFLHPLVRYVVVLLFVNVLTGIAAGMYRKSLHLAELGDFLMSRAIPYVIGAASLNLVLMFTPAEYATLAQGTGTVVWAFVIASLLGKILDNIRSMGAPIPQVLGDGPKPDATATP